MERPMAQGAYFKLGSRSRTIHETSIALDKEKEKLVQRPRNIPTFAVLRCHIFAAVLGVPKKPFARGDSGPVLKA